MPRRIDGASGSTGHVPCGQHPLVSAKESVSGVNGRVVTRLASADDECPRTVVVRECFPAQQPSALDIAATCARSITGVHLRLDPTIIRSNTYGLVCELLRPLAAELDAGFQCAVESLCTDGLAGRYYGTNRLNVWLALRITRRIEQ